MTVTVVPAAPGFSAIFKQKDGIVWKMPVIAWALDDAFDAQPIVPGENYHLEFDGKPASFDGSVGILLPDGRVEESYNRTWESEVDFVAGSTP